MSFVTGWEYTREEIRAVVGGGIGDFLPHRDGEVVAGCFRTDMNPDAPDVVLPGRGPNVLRWSEQFAAQREPVPVFLKTGTHRWCYVGRFRVAERSLDRRVIGEHARRARRGDVSQVLFLKPADGGDGTRDGEERATPPGRDQPPGSAPP